MSLVFACPVFAQSIQTEPLAKQQQGEEPNRQEENQIGNEGSNENSQNEKADESFRYRRLRETIFQLLTILGTFPGSFCT